MYLLYFCRETVNNVVIFDVPKAATTLSFLFYQIKRNAIPLNIEGFQISYHSLFRSFTDMTTEADFVREESDAIFNYDKLK